MKKAAQLGMGCDIIPAVTLDGITVSSTYIRALLERGNVEEAARFLAGPSPSPAGSATAAAWAPGWGPPP